MADPKVEPNRWDVLARATHRHLGLTLAVLIPLFLLALFLRWEVVVGWDVPWWQLALAFVVVVVLAPGIAIRAWRRAKELQAEMNENSD